MRYTTTLTITSLLSIVFTIFHLSDDFAHGISVGGMWTEVVLILLAVWLYGTLVLLERRSGLVIVFIMCLLASFAPVLHMMGRSGLSAGIKGGAGFFFSFTLMALGMTAPFSVFLSVRQLWQLQRASAR